MLADVRLAAGKQAADLPDLEFAMLQKELQDGEPRGVTEDAEAFGDRSQEVGWQRRMSHFHTVSLHND